MSFVCVYGSIQHTLLDEALSEDPMNVNSESAVQTNLMLVIGADE